MLRRCSLAWSVACSKAGWFRKTPFHKARAIRLTRIMAAARTKKASAEDGVASWSRASLRQRAIQPKVRSITQRLGCTAKPFWPSLGSTISTVMVVRADALASVGAVGEAVGQEGEEPARCTKQGNAAVAV